MTRLATIFVLLFGVGAAQAQPVDDGTVLTPPSEYNLPAGYIEDLAVRSESSATWVNGATKRTIVSSGKMHYRESPSGRWKKTRARWSKDGTDDVVSEAPSRIRINAQGMTIADASGKGIRWVLPSRPSLNNGKAHVKDQGVTWKYTPLATGVKMEGVVTATRGPQTYSFRYVPVGGLVDFTFHEDGSARSGEAVIPRMTATCADLTIIQASPWRAGNGPRLEADLDDTGCATPYVIDPTYYGTSGAEGNIQGTSGTYSSARGTTDYGYTNSIWAGQYKTGANVFWIARGYLSFDTSAIATTTAVASVEMYLYVQQDLITTDFIIYVLPFDFNTVGTSGDGMEWDYDTALDLVTNASAKTTFYNTASGITQGTYFHGPVPRGWVVPGGTTRLTLVSKEDVDASAPAVGYEIIICESSAYAGTSRDPYLDVTEYSALTNTPLNTPVNTPTPIPSHTPIKTCGS